MKNSRIVSTETLSVEPSGVKKALVREIYHNDGRYFARTFETRIGHIGGRLCTDGFKNPKEMPIAKGKFSETGINLLIGHPSTTRAFELLSD